MKRDTAEIADKDWTDKVSAVLKKLWSGGHSRTLILGFLKGDSCYVLKALGVCLVLCFARSNKRPMKFISESRSDPLMATS